MWIWLVSDRIQASFKNRIWIGYRVVQLHGMKNVDCHCIHPDFNEGSLLLCQMFLSFSLSVCMMKTLVLFGPTWFYLTFWNITINWLYLAILCRSYIKIHPITIQTEYNNSIVTQKIIAHPWKCFKALIVIFFLCPSIAKMLFTFSIRHGLISYSVFQPNHVSFVSKV